MSKKEFEEREKLNKEQEKNVLKDFIKKSELKEALKETEDRIKENFDLQLKGLKELFLYDKKSN
jgi:hypothetical protein